MKVLHILDHSLPLHSGYSFRSHSILLAQKRLGWDPVALTSPKHESSWHQEINDVEVLDNINYVRSGAVKSRTPVFGEIALMMRLYRRIVSLIQSEKPDVLHAHSPILTAFPALWAGRKFGLPVVYELRAFWEDAAVDHGTYSSNSYKYRLISTLETRVCRKADHVTVLCEGIRSDLVSRGIDSTKITPIPNAVNHRQFSECEPALDLAREWGITGKKVIAFVGSFYAYEGLDLLVEAFSKITRRSDDVALLLVGGGLMEDRLRRQVTELDLDDKVVFAGRIPNQRIPSVYMLVDILVYPRHAMRLTDLVTPLKPLEAMAMKIPCIASDVGGHLELIKDGETGIIFPAGDADTLADRTLELLDDYKLRQAIGRNGREWVCKYRTWDRIIPKYANVYNDVLGI